MVVEEHEFNLSKIEIIGLGGGEEWGFGDDWEGTKGDDIQI